MTNKILLVIVVSLLARLAVTQSTAKESVAKFANDQSSDEFGLEFGGLGCTYIDALMLRNNCSLPEIKPTNSSGRGVRQTSTVAQFCTDANLQGSCVYMYNNGIAWPQPSGYFPSGISSMRVLDLDYVVYIYDNINYVGNRWGFRAYNFVNLADYGWNDKTWSISAYFRGNVAGVTLYENAVRQGKSIYVDYGNYNSMAVASYFPGQPGSAGSIGNDKLSSMMLLKYTNVILYQNINLNIGCTSCTTASYPNNSPGFMFVDQVTPNDWASSLIVGQFV